MAQLKGAGADAAQKYDKYFKDMVANDPDIQKVISGVWGSTPVNARPSDTPKHLEKANDAASKQINQILKAKGIELPDRTFINPRSGALEGHRGWSGLNGLQKAAIIAAAGATGVGAAGALGAFGGAAAAGAGGAGAGSGAMGGLGVTSGLTALPGTTVGMGGVGGGMGWGSMLGGLAKTAGKQIGGDMVSKLMGGDALNTLGQGLGSVAGTQAHNRGVKLDAMMAGDEMALAAERERRAAEVGDLKNMQIAEYLKGGGMKEPAPAISSSGQAIPKFDFGARPATEAEAQFATELEGRINDRMRNPIKLSDYKSEMDPGKMETAMNWLSPILSTIGVAKGGNASLTPTAPNRRPISEQPAVEEPFAFQPWTGNSGGGNPFTKVNFRDILSNKQ